MDTENYIVNDIKAFEFDSKLKELQSTFKQLTYSHIPVIKEGIYEGCLSETDAYCFDGDKTIEDYRYSLEPFFVRKNTNWLDVLEAFAQNNSNIMPVLGDENEYIGYFELGDIMSLFNHTPFLNEAGGILVVEKGAIDYSFSEMCQIVESNDTKILGIFISKLENDIMQATIKVSQSNINSIVQTFRRYNYNVVSKHDNDQFLEDLRERSQYLDRYLNI